MKRGKRESINRVYESLEFAFFNFQEKPIAAVCQLMGKIWVEKNVWINEYFLFFFCILIHYIISSISSSAIASILLDKLFHFLFLHGRLSWIPGKFQDYICFFDSAKILKSQIIGAPAQEILNALWHGVVSGTHYVNEGSFLLSLAFNSLVTE